MTISKRRLIEVLACLGVEFTKEDVMQKLNLSSTTVKKYLKLLKDNGLIEEVSGDRYRITPKAEFYLEGLSITSRNVSEDKMYVFTDDTGKPIILKIDKLEKLYIAIKHNLIPREIIYHHLLNGYIAKWVAEALGCVKLSERLRGIKNVDELLNIIEEYMLIAKG